MKILLIITAMALAASSGMASAGSRSDSASSSNSNAASEANALALSRSQGGQGGNVNITTNVPASTRQEIRNSGTTTIRSAPQVVPPGFSSGHPCAYAPLSVGISVIGFGGALGGQRIDDACLLAQMGVAPAAVLMIAARNPAACQALLAVGRVRSCGGQRVASATYAAPTAAPARHVTYASLKSGQLYRKTPGGKLYRKR
jgi:hypothetical protein